MAERPGVIRLARREDARRRPIVLRAAPPRGRRAVRRRQHGPASGETANRALVLTFWAHVGARRFAEAGALLADAIEVAWPASGEVLTREQFVRANAEYPGDWATLVERLVARGDEVVSATRVYARQDPAQAFYAVSFFTVEDGRITALTEYWADVDRDAAPAVARRRSGLSGPLG